VAGLDWNALASRVQRADEAGCSEVGAALGITLTRERCGALIEMHAAARDRFITMGHLLAFVDAVLADEVGLRVSRTKVVGHGSTHVQWLGVRWKNGLERFVTIGLRRHYGSARLDAAWPDLAGWSPKHSESNRALATKWARQSEADRVTFAVHRAEPAKLGPSRDEAILRAAVIGDPDDPAPRLVYGDWLLAQGRPLGELNSLSMAPGDHRTAIKALEGRLWNELGPISKYTAPYLFVGGFVTEVKMPVAAFERHGEAFFREHPVRALDVEWENLTSAHVERLAQVPALALVRCLKLELGMFTTKRLELAGLARGVRLDSLEELRLAHVGASSKDWRDLFENLNAPRLSKLRLESTRSSVTTLEALAHNPMLDHLEEISETQKRCFERAPERHWKATFTALARHRPSLRRLELKGHAALTDDALAPLFAPSSRVSLEELSIGRSSTTGALLETIAESPRASRLAHLVVPETMAIPRAIAAILAAEHIPLTSLDLWLPASARDRNEIFDALVALPSHHSLTRLSLRGVGYGMLIPEALGERFDVRT
jgi:uncharacterized protein (TIGR02996 family)